MTGRAAIFSGADARMTIRTAAVPQPQVSEVVLRVAVCALCRSDLHTHAGRRVEPTPTVLGHELVGRIVAFGAGTPHRDSAGEAVKVGDRVSPAVVESCGDCYFCSVELPQKCAALRKLGHVQIDPGFPWEGGLADYVVLRPGHRWFRVPESLSDEVAVTANCATATAAAAIRSAREVASLSGRSVAVLGAGAVGLATTAMAVDGGASVIVCDRDADCRARALQFGALKAVAPDELGGAVRAITEGRGADIVFEASGSVDACQAAFDEVRIGGCMVLAGAVSPVGSIAFDPERTIRRHLTIRGVHNYRPNDLHVALEFLARTAERFPFATLTAGDFSLGDVNEAFAFAHRHPGRRTLVRARSRGANDER